MAKAEKVMSKEDYIEMYPEFDKTLGPLGFDWEPHKVKTADGWHLTMFRIVGRYGEWTGGKKENKDKLPVLM